MSIKNSKRIITSKDFNSLERIIKIQSVTIELLEKRIKKLENICQIERMK